jgi:hypothetical protein
MPPRSLKPQTPKRTILVVGEGDTECAFIGHLKGLYCPRGCGTSVRVENSFGGSPNDMIRNAIKKKNSGAYDQAFLLMDTDIEWPTESKNTAQENGIDLVGASPCIEGLLLWIVENNPGWCARSTDDCKRRLHQEHLSENNKLVSGKYAALLPRELIEERRATIAPLNSILSKLEGVDE